MDISGTETVDIHKILENELDGWGATGDIIPEPPPSLYGGYSPDGPYPLMGRMYGGYGSLMSELSGHIGEINFIIAMMNLLWFIIIQKVHTPLRLLGI